MADSGDSVQRLERVLSLLESRHLRVAGLVVGDIRLMFVPAGEASKANGAPAKAKDPLEKKRERYRQLFGRDPPNDEALTELDGVL